MAWQPALPARVPVKNVLTSWRLAHPWPTSSRTRRLAGTSHLLAVTQTACARPYKGNVRGWPSSGIFSLLCRVWRVGEGVACRRGAREAREARSRDPGCKIERALCSPYSRECQSDKWRRVIACDKSLPPWPVRAGGALGARIVLAPVGALHAYMSSRERGRFPA